jgi:hypothetical protein
MSLSGEMFGEFVVYRLISADRDLKEESGQNSRFSQLNWR